MMKNLLWDYFGVERAIPARAIVSSQEDLEPSDSYLALCAANSDNLLDDAVVVSAASNVPLILFLGLFIISWAFSALNTLEEHSFAHIKYATSGAVPLYLKLGRLIYYS